MSTFSKMSDLVADADDLIAGMRHSKDPEVQALKAKVEASIDDIRRQARKNFKETRVATGKQSIAGSENANAYVIAMAVATVTGLLIYGMLARRKKVLLRQRHV